MSVKPRCRMTYQDIRKSQLPLQICKWDTDIVNFSEVLPPQKRARCHQRSMLAICPGLCWNVSVWVERERHRGRETGRQRETDNTWYTHTHTPCWMHIVRAGRGCGSVLVWDTFSRVSTCVYWLYKGTIQSTFENVCLVAQSWVDGSERMWRVVA
jgi:hypothetical protein